MMTRILTLARPRRRRHACGTTRRLHEALEAAPKPRRQTDEGRSEEGRRRRRTRCRRSSPTPAKLLKRGKAQRPRPSTRKRCKKEPEEHRRPHWLGPRGHQARQFPAAKTSLNALQKEKPDSREVILLLGLVAKEKGDYSGGIDLHKTRSRSGEGGREPTPTSRTTSSCYRLNKEYDEAEKMCRKILVGRDRRTSTRSRTCR